MYLVEFCGAQDTPIEPGYNILTLKLFYAISRSQASTAEPDPGLPPAIAQEPVPDRLHQHRPAGHQVAAR